MTTISVRRFPSAQKLERALVARLEHAIAAAGTAIMLSGGRTPLPAYRELARRNPRPAPGLRVLFSDDRYVPSTSESSNFFQARSLIDALALSGGVVLRVRTELPLQQAAGDYEQGLRDLLDSGVRIGLGLLGLGADGHTASLFSAAHLEESRGRLAIAVNRPDGMQAVSVTPDLLSRVSDPVFVAAGADKHAVVEEFVKRDSSLIARRAVAGCPRAEIWTAP